MKTSIPTFYLLPTTYYHYLPLPPEIPYNATYACLCPMQKTLLSAI